MANEGVIKVVYALTGEVDITAEIRKPDDTIRDAQSAVALDDTGHAGTYSNPGAITIEFGDTIVAKDGSLIIGGKEFLENATADEIADAVVSKLPQQWVGV